MSLAYAVVEMICAMYRDRGAAQYDGEETTQTEHAIQCALLARSEGADPWLVCTALVHDIGHLLSSNRHPRTHIGIIDHGHLGAEFLMCLGFPPEVTETVRLHAEAKRYLCTVQPEYADILSNASRQSLVLQGGLMSAEECQVFASCEWAGHALRVRKWDDRAKIVDLAGLPPFEAFGDVLVETLKC
ncbi:MAG TPA: phosphohydrolase [Bacteroidetes bacterium]|nr:phosphohydrolase [Bacteroidota bacterium]